ncbi:MAG: hypothetical protein IPN86_24120 [Saprospiraceae bacterium]|nr:hypothetical protein [Saprospiraceae bacterium]
MLAGKINAFNGKSLDNISIVKQQNLDIENKLANSNGSFSFDNFEQKR